MSKNFTIYDIAREAGVSTATVSRVMSGSDAVRSQTAQRVLDVMQKYHYRPSAIARSLYTKSSRTLCILLPELGNPYYSSIFSSVIHEANAAGYMLETLYQPYDRSITEHMAQRLIEHRVDGVILNGEFLTHSTDAQLALLRRLAEYMRVVLLGGMPPVEPFPTITIDLAGCMERAVAYLHDELGHEHICLMGGSHVPENPFARSTGFLAALARRGLTGFFHPCDCDAEAAHASFETLCEEKRPTAVVCANDLVALGVLRAARDRGWQVPHDLSVIGCDNTYLCEYMPTRLTTFDIHATDTGRMAVEMATREPLSENALISGELIVRESCSQRGSRQEG